MITGYTYQQIGLIPRVVSNIDSRETIKQNLRIDFAGEKLTIPIIGSPMPDVCDGTMQKALMDNGAYGFIHRFNTIQEQLVEWNKVKRGGCAVGINGDWLERMVELHKAGCRSFCIDVANGANYNVLKTVDEIERRFSNLYITVGNISSAECMNFLGGALQNIHAIRVGIAGGSVCTTRTETGVYYPMASSVMECCKSKRGKVLIADGSIKEPSDLCKALALGGDVAMVGNIIAGCDESPGRIMRVDGNLYKVYKGAASFATQKNYGKDPKYVEGMETIVPYIGPVKKVLDRFLNGLVSSMSYMNAVNIKEYQENSDWCVLHG